MNLNNTRYNFNFKSLKKILTNMVNKKHAFDKK